MHPLSTDHCLKSFSALLPNSLFLILPAYDSQEYESTYAAKISLPKAECGSSITAVNSLLSNSLKS